jgi:hypothetical protein
MAQHAIHKPGESLLRIAGGESDRFVSEVSGGEDQGPRFR